MRNYALTEDVAKRLAISQACATPGVTWGLYPSTCQGEIMTTAALPAGDWDVRVVLALTDDVTFWVRHFDGHLIGPDGRIPW